jgi:hypothetical protein
MDGKHLNQKHLFPSREAFEQFKALRDIDPDDLEAHHHLAGVYRQGDDD